MKTFGNILWFLLSGLWLGIMWYFVGIVWCITIIGIPFGKQCFKLGTLAFLSFGKTVSKGSASHPIANLIWMIFSGLLLALSFVLDGLLWCITIVGIPFGKQCFKLADLALTPFGATIEKAQ